MAVLVVSVNVFGLILFLQGRSDRLLAAVIDPLHPDWPGMERAFAGFAIYAVSLLGVLVVAAMLGARMLVRRLPARRATGNSTRRVSPVVALALALTAAVVLVFIEVLIFQDYGIHFYEFNVLGILADAALRRDLGIQPAEVARVTGAAMGLLLAELALCLAAIRLCRWRDGALPRACGAALLVAMPGGFVMFRVSEEDIGPIHSEFESALPLGRQLLLRADSRPHIPVAARLGAGGYPLIHASDSAPALARKPNILFYVPDGLRADMVRPELAPNLLNWARDPDVLRSDRHYSSGHVSEAGIFGLLYSVNAHAFNAFVTERVPSYPLEVLKRNGYHTFFISSSRLNPYPTDHLVRMFDEVAYPENDDAALSELRRYVARRKADGRPYFILAFFYTPHYPFTSAKPHLRRYPSVGPKARPNYMNDVIQADDYFRQALATLGPRTDSTIVLVSSDHGEEIRDHGGFGHASATFWNVRVQVPFFVRLPGSDAAGRRITLSSHADIWPTLFDYLRPEPALAPRAYSDGRSLLAPGHAGPVVVNGRFFPASDRPSAVVDGQQKLWIRAKRVGAGQRLCLEATRVTTMDDEPVAESPRSAVASSAAVEDLQSAFWRFLRYTGPQTAPCSAD